MKLCSFLQVVPLFVADSISNGRTSWRKTLKEPVSVFSALNGVYITLFDFGNAVLKEEEILVEFDQLNLC